jgi:hypothetical protein
MKYARTLLALIMRQEFAGIQKAERKGKEVKRGTGRYF